MNSFFFFKFIINFFFILFLNKDNLLLTADDTVKISDFGISYMFNENQDDTISDKNASPLYCPPEACSCKYYLKNI